MTTTSPEKHERRPGSAHRFDFGPFTVFVCVYSAGGRHYHHGHEDLLSYVVYADGVDVLCDPGRPSYAPTDDAFVTAAAHNGLFAHGHPISPAPGVLVPGAFSRPTVTERTDGGSILFEAVNHTLGRSRRLRLSLEGDRLRIDDTLAIDITSPLSFTHLFANANVRLERDAVIADTIGLCYYGLSDMALEPAIRSTDYGERLACARLRAQSDGAAVTTWLLHV